MISAHFLTFIGNQIAQPLVAPLPLLNFKYSLLFLAVLTLSLPLITTENFENAKLSKPHPFDSTRMHCAL